MLTLVALMLGLSAGLRSATPLPVVAWAVLSKFSYGIFHWSLLSALAGYIVPPLLVAAAVAELIADKLPYIPSRLTRGPLIARICSGALCGTGVAIVSGASVIAPAMAGGLGGVAGAFAGYHARRYLTVTRGMRDLPVALVEDVIAIGLAVFAVTRV